MYANDNDSSMLSDKVQDKLEIVHNMFADDNHEIHVHNMICSIYVNDKNELKNIKKKKTAKDGCELG